MVDVRVYILLKKKKKKRFKGLHSLPLCYALSCDSMAEFIARDILQAYSSKPNIPNKCAS